LPCGTNYTTDPREYGVLLRGLFEEIYGIGEKSMVAKIIKLFHHPLSSNIKYLKHLHKSLKGSG
jgi:hypothetical protein